MRNDYRYIKFEHEVRRRLHPAVLEELAKEVRRELAHGNLPFSLTAEQVNRNVALMSWVASEAYWRGYDRLAPPDF
jgi:hypothetical protein